MSATSVVPAAVPSLTHSSRPWLPSSALKKSAPSTPVSELGCEPHGYVPEPGSPPYKGLQFFGEADSDLFFGREKLTSKLVSKIDPSKGNRFLAVVGASGSGKSSIIRAGLIPALQQDHRCSDDHLGQRRENDYRPDLRVPVCRPRDSPKNVGPGDCAGDGG